MPTATAAAVDGDGVVAVVAADSADRVRPSRAPARSSAGSARSSERSRSVRSSNSHRERTANRPASSARTSAGKRSASDSKWWLWLHILARGLALFVLGELTYSIPSLNLDPEPASFPLLRIVRMVFIPV